ncbi:hypothetical protein ACFQ0B_40660 [Nonomuraea thailandensis]
MQPVLGGGDDPRLVLAVEGEGAEVVACVTGGSCAIERAAIAPAPAAAAPAAPRPNIFLRLIRSLMAPAPTSPRSVRSC